MTAHSKMAEKNSIVIKSSKKSSISKVEIITVHSNDVASVTACHPVGIVVSEKRVQLPGSQEDQEPRPVFIPGCPLPQVLPPEPANTEMASEKEKHVKKVTKPSAYQPLKYAKQAKNVKFSDSSRVTQENKENYYVEKKYDPSLNDYFEKKYDPSAYVDSEEDFDSSRQLKTKSLSVHREMNTGRTEVKETSHTQPPQYILQEGMDESSDSGSYDSGNQYVRETIVGDPRGLGLKPNYNKHKEENYVSSSEIESNGNLGSKIRSNYQAEVSSVSSSDISSEDMVGYGKAVASQAEENSNSDSLTDGQIEFPAPRIVQVKRGSLSVRTRPHEKQTYRKGVSGSCVSEVSGGSMSRGRATRVLESRTNITTSSRPVVTRSTFQQRPSGFSRTGVSSGVSRKSAAFSGPSRVSGATDKRGGGLRHPGSARAPGGQSRKSAPPTPRRVRWAANGPQRGGLRGNSTPGRPVHRPPSRQSSGPPIPRERPPRQPQESTRPKEPTPSQPQGSTRPKDPPLRQPREPLSPEDSPKPPLSPPAPPRPISTSPPSYLSISSSDTSTSSSHTMPESSSDVLQEGSISEAPIGSNGKDVMTAEEVSSAGRWLAEVKDELEKLREGRVPGSHRSPRLTALLRDLTAGTLDEDKYIISRRVDRYFKEAVRRALGKDKRGEGAPPPAPSSNRKPPNTRPSAPPTCPKLKGNHPRPSHPSSGRPLPCSESRTQSASRPAPPTQPKSPSRPTKPPHTRPSFRPVPPPAQPKSSSRPNTQPQAQPSSLPANQPQFQPSFRPTFSQPHPSTDTTTQPQSQPPSRPVPRQPQFPSSFRPASHPQYHSSIRPTPPQPQPSSHPATQPKLQPSSRPVPHHPQPSLRPAQPQPPQPSVHPAQPQPQPSVRPTQPQPSVRPTQPQPQPSVRPTQPQPPQPSVHPTQPQPQPSSHPTPFQLPPYHPPPLFFQFPGMRTHEDYTEHRNYRKRDKRHSHRRTDEARGGASQHPTSRDEDKEDRGTAEVVSSRPDEDKPLKDPPNLKISAQASVDIPRGNTVEKLPGISIFPRNQRVPGERRHRVIQIVHLSADDENGDSSVDGSGAGDIDGGYGCENKSERCRICPEDGKDGRSQKRDHGIAGEAEIGKYRRGTEDMEGSNNQKRDDADNGGEAEDVRYRRGTEDGGETGNQRRDDDGKGCVDENEDKIFRSTEDGEANGSQTRVVPEEERHPPPPPNHVITVAAEEDQNRDTHPQEHPQQEYPGVPAAGVDDSNRTRRQEPTISQGHKAGRNDSSERLPGYMPEVVWEEVRVEDQERIEDSDEDAGQLLQEAENRLLLYDLRQRILDRLEERLREVVRSRTALDCDQDAAAGRTEPQPQPSSHQQKEAAQRSSGEGDRYNEAVTAAMRAVLRELVNERLGGILQRQREADATSPQPPERASPRSSHSPIEERASPLSPDLPSPRLQPQEPMPHKIRTPSPSPPPREDPPPRPPLTPQLSIENVEAEKSETVPTPPSSPPPSPHVPDSTLPPQTPSLTPVSSPRKLPRISTPERTPDKSPSIEHPVTLETPSPSAQVPGVVVEHVRTSSPTAGYPRRPLSPAETIRERRFFGFTDQGTQADLVGRKPVLVVGVDESVESARSPETPSVVCQSLDVTVSSSVEAGDTVSDGEVLTVPRGVTASVEPGEWAPTQSLQVLPQDKSTTTESGLTSPVQDQSCEVECLEQRSEGEMEGDSEAGAVIAATAAEVEEEGEMSHHEGGDTAHTDSVQVSVVLDESFSSGEAQHPPRPHLRTIYRQNTALLKRLGQFGSFSFLLKKPPYTAPSSSSSSS